MKKNLNNVALINIVVIITCFHKYEAQFLVDFDNLEDSFDTLQTIATNNFFED